MSSEGTSSRFHTTHWSLIAALPSGPTQGRGDGGGGGGGGGHRHDPEHDRRAREALEHLCNAYWRPLYAFVRHRGYTPEDAQDLTQAFLARVIETGGLGGADPDRGRFRSYLLGAMKNFMANAHDYATARKRGGGQRFVAADIAEVESRLSGIADGSPSSDADRVFDRDWARETTAAALVQLEAEWSDRGRAAQFEALRPALATGDGPDRTAVAAGLGMTENAVGVAVHRLRQRYAALVREHVARTVADDADVESELRYLITVLRGKC